jgi:hypothetical protein
MAILWKTAIEILIEFQSFMESVSLNGGVHCSIVVEALCYKPEDRGFETR